MFVRWNKKLKDMCKIFFPYKDKLSLAGGFMQMTLRLSNKMNIQYTKVQVSVSAAQTSALQSFPAPWDVQNNWIENSKIQKS